MEHNIEQAKNMKLLLSAFEQLSGLKLIFIKVKSSVLGKTRITNRNMNNYLDVKKDHTLSDI
jgi:GTP cyclohydrolase II